MRRTCSWFVRQPRPPLPMCWRTLKIHNWWGQLRTPLSHQQTNTTSLTYMPTSFQTKHNFIGISSTDCCIVLQTFLSRCASVFNNVRSPRAQEPKCIRSILLFEHCPCHNISLQPPAFSQTRFPYCSAPKSNRTDRSPFHVIVNVNEFPNANFRTTKICRPSPCQSFGIQHLLSWRA